MSPTVDAAALSALVSRSVFFFNDTATTEIYTLSLHDALPISVDRRPTWRRWSGGSSLRARTARSEEHTSELQSRVDISYAVFCLKNKERNRPRTPRPHRRVRRAHPRAHHTP